MACRLVQDVLRRWWCRQPPPVFGTGALGPSKVRLLPPEWQDAVAPVARTTRLTSESSRKGRVARRWTDEMLRTAVQHNTCLTDVLRELKLRPAGGNHKSVARHITRLKLSTAHFSNERRVRGLRAAQLAGMLADEVVFCRDSAASPGAVKRRYRRRKPYACVLCGNPGQHRGKPLTLQLDHKNGCPHDNRMSNLRWLCPNCHSQTSTFAGRGSRAVARGPVALGRAGDRGPAGQARGTSGLHRAP